MGTIINVANDGFLKLFGCDELALPKRWTGYDFSSELSRLYSILLAKAQEYLPINEDCLRKLNDICQTMEKIVTSYSRGLVGTSYNQFVRLMNKYFADRFLQVYEKGIFEPFDEDRLKLYRIRNSSSELSHRSELFHAPEQARFTVNSSRYSIAGYPSLYLSTSLKLSSMEACSAADKKETVYYSEFMMQRPAGGSNERIRVIDLAIKPQDFIEREFDSDGRILRSLSHKLNDSKFRVNYLYWYPIIAACSYIRQSSEDVFHPEYIIPQLLMQWVRYKSRKNELLGIRYFSCRDEKSSDLGFNYVFPVNNFDFVCDEQAKEKNYCSILQKDFLLTEPKEYCCNCGTNDCSGKMFHHLSGTVR